MNATAMTEGQFWRRSERKEEAIMIDGRAFDEREIVWSMLIVKEEKYVRAGAVWQLCLSPRKRRYQVSRIRRGELK